MQIEFPEVKQAPVRRRLPVQTVAEAYLALLKSRGIDYLYVNAGTDFPSIVEATRASRSRVWIFRSRSSQCTRIWPSAWLTGSTASRAGRKP